jgi:hypothetical protein
MCVYVANQNGLLDRLKESSKRIYNNDIVQHENEASSVKSNDIEIASFNEGQETYTEEYDYIADTNRVNNVSSATQDNMIENAKIEEPEITKEKSLLEEAMPQSASSYEDSYISTKAYSRVYSKDEYLNQIIDILNSHKISNKVVNDFEIEINGSDVNTISSYLESFIDIEIELKGENIIIKLK